MIKDCFATLAMTQPNDDEAIGLLDTKESL